MEEIIKKEEKEIEVFGFVDSIRNVKWVVFVILRNNEGKVQITLEKSENNNEMLKVIENLNSESTIKVKGRLLVNEKVKLGGVEIIPTSIEVTSYSKSNIPINIHDKKAQLIDQRIDYRWLDLRCEENNLIFKVQSDFVRYMREYLYNENFLELHSPKLIGTASESGSEVFEVKYFDRKAYLAQSPQFYKQMAIASGFEKIFEIGPVFRAEKSYTSRHATEFTGIDIEMANINSYEDIMDLEENLLKYSLEKVNKKYGQKVKELFSIDIIVPINKIPRVKICDLYKILEEKYGYVVEEKDKKDLNAEAERLAYKYALECFNSEFIFITDYDKEKRAFYHLRKDDVPQGYDLIWKGTEITTGAQREHRIDILTSQAKEKGLDKDVEFYLEFFKYGCPPHGGFGLGLDRITMLLLNLPSLKESMFVYRGPNRLKP